MPSAETVVDSPAEPTTGTESKSAAAAVPASADPQKQLVGPSPPGSITEGADDDAFLVEFDGPDDPYHPFNLPLSRRWAMTVIVSSASLCACVAPPMLLLRAPCGATLSAVESAADDWLSFLAGS